MAIMEQTVSIKQPRSVRALLPLCPLFASLACAILLWGWAPAQPEAAEPAPAIEAAEPAPLVTAAQLEAMAYTDSVMGEMSWALTEASVEELNRVLRAYGILSAEEISQFLAQAMVETEIGRAHV